MQLLLSHLTCFTVSLGIINNSGRLSMNTVIIDTIFVLPDLLCQKMSEHLQVFTVPAARPILSAAYAC